MSARAAAILVALLVLLGGGAYLYQKRQSADRPADAQVLGQKIFPDLKASDIASIRFASPGATLTLQRKADGWALAERGGFPADAAKVREFVIQAIGLKVGQSEPIGEKDRARLNLDPSGTQLEFAGADGKALAKLVIGKKYFKRETENADKAPADGRFVQRPEQPGTVYVVADPLLQASARSADWIDRGRFKVEKVKTLEVRYPDGSGWRIGRSADNADWKLAGAKADEKLDIARANAASYSLSLLELADVAPDDAKGRDQDTGLDKPILVNAATLAGASYAIKVGRLEGDNYYVSVATTSAEEKDKALAARVLLVPKSMLEDTLKPRAELLQKKQDTKK
jgi:hypothetical protein